MEAEEQDGVYSAEIFLDAYRKKIIAEKQDAIREIWEKLDRKLRVASGEGFSLIAQAHADTCLQNHKRGDGSFYHILEYDIRSGECLGGVDGQGALIDGEAIKGSWSRGQSWALYGYALSYRYTGRQEYLDTAKQVANYFIACVSQTGYVPLYDFRQAFDCDEIDTSAGAIAASGLIDSCPCRSHSTA